MALADLETQLAGERSRLGDRRGLVFDIAMLAANALLVPFLARRVESWAWTGVIAYTAGAWLKSPPLRHRLAIAGARPFGARLMMGTLVLCVFLMALLFTCGWPPVASLLIPIVPAAITGRALTPKTTGHLPRRWREWLADALILYCAIFFALIWDQAVAGMHVAATDPLWARAIVLIVALPVFFMFYAPVRLLFLVEDGHLRATWLRMALAGLPLVRHLLID